MASLDQVRKLRYGELYDVVDMAQARPTYERAKKACVDAIDHHNRDDRPLEVLVVHGSSRSSFRSCAHEHSNSQLLLETGVAHLRTDPAIKVDTVRLRDVPIEACNGCYSSASALCGFPCDCFMGIDGMYGLYPKVLRCDVLLISTGVYQSAMSSRLKMFADRLISLDGGFFRERLEPKDAVLKDRMVALSQNLAKEGNLPYDARMWGRAAGYVITSKDDANPHESVTGQGWVPPVGYLEGVAWSLRSGFADYGFFHADLWHAGGGAHPDQELSQDKAWYAGRSDLQARVRAMVDATVRFGEQLRRDPPPFDGGGRVNRT